MSGKWNGRLRGDRGMTLTELIASLAIAFILMSFLIRMYTYTGNMFETSASADDLRRTTQVIVDYLEDRISCAESLVMNTAMKFCFQGMAGSTATEKRYAKRNFTGRERSSARFCLYRQKEMHQF